MPGMVLQLLLRPLAKSEWVLLWSYRMHACQCHSHMCVWQRARNWERNRERERIQKKTKPSRIGKKHIMSRKKKRKMNYRNKSPVSAAKLQSLSASWAIELREWSFSFVFCVLLPLAYVLWLPYRMVELLAAVEERKYVFCGKIIWDIELWSSENDKRRFLTWRNC